VSGGISPLSIGYHDNVDQTETIIVDCLQGETLRVAFGYNMTIFLGRERLTELRDKITEFLELPMELPLNESVQHPGEPVIDDGGVTDIERENDARTAREDSVPF
jgi:hypothetical protein